MRHDSTKSHATSTILYPTPDPGEPMTRPTRASDLKYRLAPEDIEGFDSLAELALDMRWSWNQATDKLWRQLDPNCGRSRITPGSFFRQRSSSRRPGPRTLVWWTRSEPLRLNWAP